MGIPILLKDLERTIGRLNVDAVEVQALWYADLRFMERLLEETVGEEAAAPTGTVTVTVWVLAVTDACIGSGSVPGTTFRS